MTPEMKIRRPRCLRCRRRWRGTPDWTAQITEDFAEVNGLICPECTTATEHAEVIVRRVAGQTVTAGINEEGRWWKKRPDPQPTNKRNE